MTASMGTCSCGATAHREIPAGLQEPYLGIANRTPFVCTECADRREAEDADREREQEALERQQRLQARRRASGIPPTLADLMWKHVADNRPDVFSAAQAWSTGELPGLVLTGLVGRGKTWLATAAACARLDHAPVRWVDTSALLSDLGREFGDDRREAALDVLAGSQALVLDDIDKVRPTDYAAEQLYVAINGRITAGAGLLVTTNLGLDALAAMFPERFGKAIVSRLVGYCETFALRGRDRRLDRFRAAS